MDNQDLLHCIVADIQKFDSNSNVLKVLFELIDTITFQTVDPGLVQALYTELELLQILTQRISLSEYQKKQNERKDIYAFIHKLVHTLHQTTLET